MPQLPGLPVDDDEIRLLLQSDRAREEEQVRQNTNPPGITPDKRAEALTLSDATGQPLDLVERGLEAAKKQHRDHALDRELLRAPEVRKFLATSPAAAAAADDIPSLVKLENRLTLGASILRGTDDQQGIVGRFLEAVGELTDKYLPGAVLPGGVTPTALRQIGGGIARHNEAQSDALGYRSTVKDAIKGPAEFAQYVKETVGTQIPVMAPMIAGGIAGGLVGGPLGAVIGAAIPAFVGGVGETQGTLKGLDPNASAPELVFLGGSAVAALDTALPGLLGSRLARTFGREVAEEVVSKALLAPVAPKFFRGLAKHGAIEMSSEAVTEAFQEAIGQVTGYAGAGQQVDWSQVGQAMVESAAAGAVAGGSFSAAGSVVAHPRERARYAASQQGKAFFEALGQDTVDSKLYARLPGAVAEFVARATKDGPLETVYAPTETFEAYWQTQGVDAATMAAELTGKADALAHAKATGTDLAIPLATYVEKLAATEHNPFFTDNLRLGRPDAMTFVEGREFAASFQAALDAAGSETDAATTPDPEAVKADPAAAIGAHIQAQVEASGSHTPQQAAFLGRLYTAFYGELGRRYGRDPQALFAARPLRVQLDNGQIFTPRAEGVGRPTGGVDIPASQGTPGETPAGRATRRQAHVEALVSAYTRDAVAQDPGVDPAAIRAELETRLSMLEEVRAAKRESGHGQDLLRELAAMGGLKVDKSENDAGELERLLGEGGDERTAYDKGRPRTWNGVSGVLSADPARGGVTLGEAYDRMRHGEEARFAHITDTNALLEAIEEALQADPDVDEIPGTEALQELGIVPGTKWWGESWASPPDDVDDSLAGGEGDADPDFDPELFQHAPGAMPAAVEDAAALDAIEQLPEVTNGTFRTRREFKLFIQARLKAALRAAGVRSLSPGDAKVRDYLVRMALREIGAELSRGSATGVGWYDLKIRQALRVVSLIHPELATDADAQFVFKYALAVTSNGLEADGRNFVLAESAYAHYKQHGALPTGIGEGTAAPMIDAHLALFNSKVQAGGLDAWRSFLLTKTTVGALRRQGFKIAGEEVGLEVFGAIILGPKIGNGFLMNLHGEFDQLTIDRWFVRTWRRWLGTLIVRKPEVVAENRVRVRAAIDALPDEARVVWMSMLGLDLSAPDLSDAAVTRIGLAIFQASTDANKRAVMDKTRAGSELRKAGNTLGKNVYGESEVPGGARNRTLMREVVTRARDVMAQRGYTLAIADLQAVLWYPEKRLYDTATKKNNDDAPPDYATAASALARAKGISEHAITGALDAAQADYDRDARAAGRRARGSAAPRRAAGTRRSGAPGDPASHLRDTRRKVAAARTAAKARKASEFHQREQPARGPALAAQLNADTWYHGTQKVVTGPFKAPLFVTTNAEGADWFASEKMGWGGRDTMYPMRVSVRNPFTLDSYEDAVVLRDILVAAGIEVTLTPPDYNHPQFGHVGWDWYVPAVLDEAGYDGNNPIDVSYLPRARAALQAAGFDAFYTAYDPLANGHIPALALFDPATQARSAYGNQEFYQREVTPSTFTSRVVAAVEASPLGKATGAQWQATIKSSKTGINLDEFEALGLTELAPDTIYSKERLLELVRAAQIEVEVHVIDDTTAGPSELEVERLADKLMSEEIGRLHDTAPFEPVFRAVAQFDPEEDAWSAYVVGADTEEHHGTGYNSEEAALEVAQYEANQANVEARHEYVNGLVDEMDWSEFRRLAEDKLRGDSDPALDETTHYSTWQEKGRDPGSYREVFLTAPNARQKVQVRVLGGITDIDRSILLNAGGGDHAFFKRMEQLAAKGRDEDEREALNLMSGHREELRKIIQRRADAGDPEVIVAAYRERWDVWDRAIKAIEAGRWTTRTVDGPGWSDGHDPYEHIDNPIVRIRFNARTAVDGTKTMFLEEVQPPQKAEQQRMPALFTKNWRELAFKWAIEYAATNGFDQVAWTHGEQQSKRYGLLRVVDQITWRNVQTIAPDESAAALEARQVVVMLRSANNRGTNTLIVDAATGVVERVDVEGLNPLLGKPLADVVGEERAARILVPLEPRRIEETGDGDLPFRVVGPPIVNGAPVTRTFATREEAARMAQVYAQGLMAGVDLQYGGEGLTRLYDKDFPVVVNKLPVMKKAGAKVEPVPVTYGKLAPPLPATLAGVPTVPGPADYQRVARDENYRRRMEARAKWEREHPAVDDTRMHQGVRITPAMREQVRAGQALFQEEGPKRGAKPGDIKGAYSPDTNVIRLVAGKADLSTFLHESGHFFLEVLTDIAVTVDPATATPAEQQLLRDLATVLKHGGFQGTLQEWRAMPLEGRRGVHEAWADSFEQYLFDGKTPNPELRPLFAQFRSWIYAVYLNARGKGVDISPELRGVFDRLLASDAAIADAQHEAQQAPLFTDAASAGVDPLTFAAYRKDVEEASLGAREALDRRLLADWRRERQAWWKAERAVERAKVQAEVYAEPIYQALAIMRTGLLPDGTRPAFGNGQPLKLSKAIIKREASRELAGAVLGKRPAVFSVEGGVHPQVAAELFGFASGDALLEAIAQAAPMNQVIDSTADQRMRERHGDLLLDGMKLQEIAEAAIFDQRAKVISAELKALSGGMAKAAIPPGAVLKAAAEAVIRRTTVRELNPGRYLSAARRASQASFQAFGANDRAEAIKQKQTELAALAYWRAARDAKDRADTVRDQLQKYAEKASTRARIGKAGQDYLDQIDGFLDRYEFARVSNKALDRRTSLRAFVAKVENEGLPNPIPDALLDDARRVNWRELSVEELEGVGQAVQQIAHLARLKNKLLKAKDDRELSEVRAEIAASIRANVPARDIPLEPQLEKERRRAGREGWFASHRKIAHISRELDGFKDGGPMWSAVQRPLNEAGAREASMNADATARLGAIFSAHYSRTELGAMEKPHWIEALGPRDKSSAKLSKQGQLMVALNWGNETNRKRLMAGYGWSEPQVQAILDGLDKRDWLFVQDVWDFVNSYWPEIAAKEQRVKGVAPRKELATPVYTRHGEFAGGYFPLAWEGERSAEAVDLTALGDAQLAKAAAYLHVVTQHGHTVERVEGDVRKPVKLSFGVLFDHTSRVIHDLTHHEVLLDVQRVLAGPEVHTAIYETLGPRAFDQYRRALHAIAVGDLVAQHEVETRMGMLRAGASIAGLGWSFTTAALQPLGLTQSMQRIGVRWVGRGIRTWMTGGPEGQERTVAWIHERSEFMRTRMLTQQREINELRNQVRPHGIHQAAIADSFFYTIAKLQVVADVPTWLGAYAKAEEAGHEGDTAAAIADQAVLDSQGGGQQKDLSAVQRGSPAWKMWTNFYSFFNTTYNLWLDSVHEAKHTRDPRAIGRLAADALLLFVVPAVLGHFLRSALTGDLGDELEDWQGLMLALLGENLAYMAGTMIGTRELAGIFQGYAGYEGPAGARAFSTAGDLAKQVSQLDADKDYYGLDEPFFRALNAAGGVYFHYPASQVDKTVRGILALVNGETSNPAAILFGPGRKKQP